MNWYKKAQQIYRGDPDLMDFEKYDSEHGTKELGKQLGSSLANGPGIYFSNTEKEAQGYGQNISKFNLSNANILNPQSKKLTYQQINKILSGIDKEKMETAATNWDENYNIGKRMLIESILNNENVIEQLMGIWANVFYHQNPNAFMELMTKNKIDGIAVPQKWHPEGAVHYIIYNKAILK